MLANSQLPTAFTGMEMLLRSLSKDGLEVLAPDPARSLVYP